MSRPVPGSSRPHHCPPNTADQLRRAHDLPWFAMVLPTMMLPLGLQPPFVSCIRLLDRPVIVPLSGASVYAGLATRSRTMARD